MDRSFFPTSVKPPRQAYRFWPHPTYICSGTNKKTQRFIFTNQQFTPFQLQKLKRLMNQIEKGKLKYIQITNNWAPSDFLRFCYGTSWKTRTAVKVLQNHLNFLQNFLPADYRQLYPKIHDLIRTGCLYIHGRDFMYRPILIINFGKFNFSKHPVQEYMQLTCFYLQFMLKEMMIPGQIENWVVIDDMAKHGLGSLSISSIKRIFGILQDNYRCRLGVSYVINPPKSISMIWRCCKPFLDSQTIAKIKINKGALSQELISSCNPGQLQKQYGGRAPNVASFWPPIVPSCPFTNAAGQIQGVKGKDTYQQFYQSTVEIQKVYKVQGNNRKFSESQCSSVKSAKLVLESLQEINPSDLSEHQVCFSFHQYEQKENEEVQRISNKFQIRKSQKFQIGQNIDFQEFMEAFKTGQLDSVEEEVDFLEVCKEESKKFQQSAMEMTQKFQKFEQEDSSDQEMESSRVSIRIEKQRPTPHCSFCTKVPCSIF